MANYLNNLVDTNQNYSGSSSSAATARGIASVASAVSGQGMGSKPVALHTEYASGQANWDKPYGSNTDIVFYMVRAS